MIHHRGRRPSDRARLRSQRYGRFNVERLECRRLLYSPPVANNVSAVTPDDIPAAIDVLTNDSDPNSGGMIEPSSVTVVTGPSDGSASVNTTTGQVTYTPKTGFTGTDQFTYTVADNFDLTSNTATVTILVFTPKAPSANNESATTVANTAVPINVLDNDTDPNPGGALVPSTVTVVTGPRDGSTSLNTSTGAITYTPKTGFTGEDQFTYTVSDNFGLTSNTAIVKIQVTASSPVASDYNVVTPGNTPVTITTLAKAIDPNPGGILNPASVIIVAGPSHGSTSLNTSNGDIIYNPSSGFSGMDQFTYTVSDNFGQTSNIATVTIQVTASPPVAANDNAATPVNTPVVIDVLANDTDPNSGGVLIPSSVIIVTGPSHGSKPSVNPTTGTVTYTPDPGFLGTDQFTYTVSDNFGLTSNPATVTIRVTASSPIANDDSDVTPRNTPVVINVLENDTDPNPGGMLIPASVFVTVPGHGSASVNTSTGDVTYTPTPGFSGIDQFTYTVSDNFDVISNAATVTILVNPPLYNPPVANADNAVTPGNTPAVINLLANDTDPNPGGMLVPASVFVVTAPSHGSTSLNTTTGDITYTPKSGFWGIDRFTYTVSDNFGLTSTPATVTIVVTASAPIANDDTAVTPANTPVVIDVLANDTDPNPAGVLNPSTVTIVMGTGPNHGPKPSVNPTTGAITYTPGPGFSGMDQFMYTVSDNFGLTSTAAMVTIQVTSTITATGVRFQVYPGLPLNDAPIATFTDANMFAPLAQPSGPYSATIDWGNGQTSTGTVSKPNPSGVFTVIGSFTYSIAFTSQFVPGTAIPVTVTITNAQDNVGTANSAAVLLSTGTGAPFGGGLADTPNNGPNITSGDTTTDQPTFSGTAPPFSVVQLMDATTSLGLAVASASGQWNLSAKSPLLDGTYNLTATVTIPGFFQSGTINLPPILVDTAPPQVVSVQPSSGASDVTVTFQDDVSGMNTASLLNPNNYLFAGPGLVAFHPHSASLVLSGNLPSGQQEVLLTIKAKPRFLKKIQSLRITGTKFVLGSSGVTVNIGVTDNAGNPLGGNSRFSISFGSGRAAEKSVVKLPFHRRKT
jgi:large repetitive protein